MQPLFETRQWGTRGSELISQFLYVVQGAVNIKIHHTSYILAPGGMAIVPRGESDFTPHI